MDMYFPVDLESAKPPVMIVAAAAQAREKAIGVCHPVDTSISLGFGIAAQSYYHYSMQHKDATDIDVDLSWDKIKVLAITRQPEHGRLILADVNDPYGGGYRYIPNEGYLGKDRVEALVAVGDDVIRVVHNLVMIGEYNGGLGKFDPRFGGRSTDQLDGDEFDMLCPKGGFWIISGAPSKTLSLSALLANAATAFQGFSDLPGLSTDQTVGDRITLDRNTAGYGGYIDPTPLNNTDNHSPVPYPNVWKAHPQECASLNTGFVHSPSFKASAAPMDQPMKPARHE